MHAVPFMHVRTHEWMAWMHIPAIYVYWSITGTRMNGGLAFMHITESVDGSKSTTLKVM